jgi:tight adherence protein B
MKRFVLALLVAIVGLAAPAHAAESVTIRKVDTTAFPSMTASVLFSGGRPSVTAVSLRENGRIVPDVKVVPIGESTTAVGVVLVIDTSGSMKANGRLDQAKAAARAFVNRKLPNDQIALVAFANEARVAVNFTSDGAPLLAAIDALAPSGETALWDAVRTGANLLTDRPDLLPYLVVLSDGADTVSVSSAADALGSARGAQAGVFTVAITGPGESDAPALRSLAEATGGSFAETADPRQLGKLYEALQGVLQNQYELRWTSKATASPVDLTVQISGVRADAQVPLNGVSLGSATQPRLVSAPSAPGPLGSSSGPMVIALIAALAGGLAGAGFALFRRQRAVIDDVLQAYSGGPVSPSAAAAGAPTERALIPESVRRAVERTTQLAGGGGALERLDGRLDQADLKLSAQEAVLFYAAGVTVLSLAALIASGPMIGLAAFILTALIPIALLNQLGQRRRSSFTKQLPDTLQLLASSLRAGYSLLQGFDAVAEEVADPMGRELRRVVLETRLGREMEASLEDLAGRMRSQDFDWVVMAIRIQREVGGNLAELLTSVAETMISRERLRREVSALTAEGRLSAIIVGALPLLLGVAIAVLNPGYLNALFTTTVGKGMVLGATLLTVVGFAWMKKTIEIEV